MGVKGQENRGCVLGMVSCAGTMGLRVERQSWKIRHRILDGDQVTWGLACLAKEFEQPCFQEKK